MRQLVLILLPTGRCSVENVARHLGVDRRTVHRKLERAALTFSGLVNQARLDLSDRYLAHPTRTMAEIADLLGFSGSSALARWHQTQFGIAGHRAAQGAAGTGPVPGRATHRAAHWPTGSRSFATEPRA
ncbi:MAG: helix-turn-helix domain-containing protein [Chromatiales bacterium]|nr:helix-turn-helix domain-containing protein [Chromatiales bacterium]